VETLIVLSIVLILSSTVGFASFRFVERAKQVAARDQIENLSMALSGYYMDCGCYPTAAQGFDALWQKPILDPVPDGWNGPYVGKEIPADPWGNPYHYEIPGPNGLPFSVASYGDDGAPGGRDIVSWKN